MITVDNYKYISHLWIVTQSLFFLGKHILHFFYPFGPEAFIFVELGHVAHIISSRFAKLQNYFSLEYAMLLYTNQSIFFDSEHHPYLVIIIFF